MTNTNAQLYDIAKCVNIITFILNTQGKLCTTFILIHFKQIILSPVVNLALEFTFKS